MRAWMRASRRIPMQPVVTMRRPAAYLLLRLGIQRRELTSEASIWMIGTQCLLEVLRCCTKCGAGLVRVTLTLQGATLSQVCSAKLAGKCAGRGGLLKHVQGAGGVRGRRVGLMKLQLQISPAYQH